MKHLLFALLCVPLITYPAAAKQVDHIIITAPDGTVTPISDPFLVRALGFGSMEQPPLSVPPPRLEGDGYLLERQSATPNGRAFITFDRVRYYPAGSQGYFFYIGIENGWSEYDGQWFAATPTAVAAMNHIIAGETTVSLAPLVQKWLAWFWRLRQF